MTVLISLVNVDFNCPDCNCPHGEDDWYPKYRKSKDTWVYIRCKGCKRHLGVSTDIRGDVVVWLKSEEQHTSH